MRKIGNSKSLLKDKSSNSVLGAYYGLKSSKDAIIWLVNVAKDSVIAADLKFILIMVPVIVQKELKLMNKITIMINL